uniref:Uncharacterized protein n=1 Tax=Aegilops tauschii subsp. strangulata TaxID=200361 RepID=A0A453MYI4_AEGTS
RYLDLYSVAEIQELASSMWIHQFSIPHCSCEDQRSMLHAWSTRKWNRRIDR